MFPDQARLHGVVFQRSVVLAIAVTLAGSAALGDVIHVPGDHTSIGAAVAAAQNGDTVLVADGVYDGPANRDVDFGGRVITVRSENGPENCVIDCQHEGRAFILLSGETSDTLIEGFTIINGNAATGNGGAIDCALDSSPTIRGCVFRGNHASALGGAVACRGESRSLIEGCVFIDNTSFGTVEGSQGGAVSCFFLSDATIVDCVFINNFSQWGGALDCSLSNTNVVNCRFIGNVAQIGGGAVMCSVADPVFTNCTFSRNSASFGGTIILAGAVLESFPTLTNCVMWDDAPNEIQEQRGVATVRYSIVQGGWPGPGNLALDPRFVDPFADDFRLASNSPAIDAADNGAVPTGIVTDIDGNLRFIDDPKTPDTGLGTLPIVDMGAHEFQTLPRRRLPDAFDVGLGDFESGELPSLFFSDDGYLQVGQRAALTPLLPLIRIDVYGTAGTEVVAVMTAILEAATTAMPSRPPQRLSLFDYEAQAFEIIDERTATLIDSTVEVTIDSDADRFVEPDTTAVRMRIEYFDPGDVFFPAWSVRVDQAVWGIVP